MRGFGHRDGVERELRASRPEARSDFVLAQAKKVHRASGRPAFRASRLAFALALTTFLIGGFVSFGGASYTASAAKSVAKVVAPDKVAKSSAAQQYGNPGEATNGVQSSGAAGVAAAAQGNLPFTGLSLVLTVVIGIVLVSTGIVLRRRENQS